MFGAFRDKFCLTIPVFVDYGHVGDNDIVVVGTTTRRQGAQPAAPNLDDLFIGRILACMDSVSENSKRHGVALITVLLLD
jgi:hypothetical protein